MKALPLIIVIMIILLAGCGSQRVEIPETIIRGLQDVQRPKDFSGEINELRNDVKTSSNVTQNSITGVGANLGKLSETIQGFGGDLAHINIGLKNSIEAQASINSSIKANSEIVADLRARLDASVNAQVALKNELEQLQISSNAGRDSIVQTIQFSKEMQAVLERSYSSNYWIVCAFCGLLSTIVAVISSIIGKILYNAKKKSDQDYREAMEIIKNSHHGKAGFGHAKD